MLSFIRRGQRWLTALFVVLIGGVFAVFIGLGGPLQGRAPSGTVVEVGPYRFGVREFERARSRRLELARQSLGEAFDERAYADQLNQAAASFLMDRALLALEAERLGLTVAQEEIEQLWSSIPELRDEEGRFDVERFRGYVRSEWGTEAGFLEEQRMSLLAEKMRRLLYDLPRVTEAEAREALRYGLEEVRLAYVVLDPASPPGEPADPTPDEIDQVLADRLEEVKGLYDARTSEYDRPEQIRARHILIRVPEDAGAEEGRIYERVDAIRQRLLAGEDFAQLAEELSEDPGSKTNGGDLGFFGRGRMVPEFEEVAFTQEIGVVSEPVRSQFGYHLIRTEEKREAQSLSFDDVRLDLAREIRVRELEAERLGAVADRLAEAVEGGSSLEAAARAEGLTLERTALLRRRPDGYVPGLGAAQDLLAHSFTLEAGASSPRVFRVQDKLVLFQVLERTEPNATQIAEQLETTREELLSAKREAAAAAWLSARRQQLRDSGDLRIDLESISG